MIQIVANSRLSFPTPRYFNIAFQVIPTIINGSSRLKDFDWLSAIIFTQTRLKLVRDYTLEVPLSLCSKISQAPPLGE